MLLPKLTCPKCGHSWVPNVESPVKCPKCKHRLGSRIYKKREVTVPAS